ncbi:MAG: ribonuclease HI family protein [Nanoarchaeota archaeon]|nr:ribonuclease HI family protein [Nanoarchaeota archaeon]
MSKINIFTDGASRGNPGNAGIGVAVYDGNALKKEISKFLGKKTNNEAEYSAVIEALIYLNEKKIKKANLFSDSEFLVKQLNGQYKVKAETIKPLYEKVQFYLKEIEVSFHWIPREDNNLADSLANKGIDERNKISKPKAKSSPNSTINSSLENSKVQISNTNFSSNSSSNSNSNSLLDNLKLDKAFFGKINCLKIQMNLQNDIYFHMGILNNKTKEWTWEKVKMSDVELGEIINLLRKETGKCSFFHSFADKKTQIWCNKSETSFSIKISSVSKNFSIGEFETFRIILENCIIIKNFI